MKKIVFWLLNLTWCLPQNIIGFILFLFNLRKSRKTYNGRIIVRWWYGGSVSLGAFIFVSSYDKDLVRHEYGHTIQSLFLGVLYLFIIGIPSIIWAGCFEKYRTKNNISYYSFYTESWANKLVGLKY